MIVSVKAVRRGATHCLGLSRPFASSDFSTKIPPLSKVLAVSKISELQFPEFDKTITDTTFLDPKTLEGKGNIKRTKQQIETLSKQLKQQMKDKKLFEAKSTLERLQILCAEDPSVLGFSEAKLLQQMKLKANLAFQTREYDECRDTLLAMEQFFPEEPTNTQDSEEYYQLWITRLSRVYLIAWKDVGSAKRIIEYEYIPNHYQKLPESLQYFLQHLNYFCTVLWCAGSFKQDTKSDDMSGQIGGKMQAGEPQNVSEIFSQSLRLQDPVIFPAVASDTDASVAETKAIYFNNRVCLLDLKHQYKQDAGDAADSLVEEIFQLNRDCTDNLDSAFEQLLFEIRTPDAQLEKVIVPLLTSYYLLVFAAHEAKSPLEEIVSHLPLFNLPLLDVLVERVSKEAEEKLKTLFPNSMVVVPILNLAEFLLKSDSDALKHIGGLYLEICKQAIQKLGYEVLTPRLELLEATLAFEFGEASAAEEILGSPTKIATHNTNDRIIELKCMLRSVFSKRQGDDVTASRFKKQASLVNQTLHSGILGEELPKLLLPRGFTEFYQHE